MISSHHEPFARQSALLASNERLGGEGQHHVRHPADVRTEEPRRHHADDGERHALHGELAPDDVAGAGEALPPEAMTDDGDGAVRRGAAVVGGRDHPAADGGDAEHVEEPAADVRAVHGVASGRSADRSNALGGPRERAVEQLGLACPDLFPDRIGP